jgi:shikimate dehydrogenase
MVKSYRAELVGAFGCPIDENPTGVMEEAAFAATGLNYRYLTIEVKDDGLEAAMEAVRAFNMKGINLTIPHKVKVLNYLDELSPAATIIGAVNTVVNKDGRLWGENTDGKGFLLALAADGVDVRGKVVTILGAGGAARAIGVECALSGASDVVIVNANRDRGETLATLIAGKTEARSRFMPWDHVVTIPDETDILVNATSVGLYPHVDDKPNIDYASIPMQAIVTDVIFNDPNSLFLQEAKERGCRTINGLGMLVHQGALNFQLWTGVEAPRDLMMDTLRKEFGLAAETASP